MDDRGTARDEEIRQMLDRFKRYLRELDNPNEQTRGWATDGFVRMFSLREREISKCLICYFQDPRLTERLKKLLIGIAEDLGSDDVLVGLFGSALNCGKPIVKHATVEVLFEMGTEYSESIIVRALAFGNDDTKTAILERLPALVDARLAAVQASGIKSGTHDANILSKLGLALAKSHITGENVKVKKELLKRMGNRGVCEGCVLALLSNDEEVRATAREVLLHLGNGTAMGRCISYLTDERREKELLGIICGMKERKDVIKQLAGAFSYANHIVLKKAAGLLLGFANEDETQAHYVAKYSLSALAGLEKKKPEDARIDRAEVAELLRKILFTIDREILVMSLMVTMRGENAEGGSDLRRRLISELAEKDPKTVSKVFDDGMNGKVFMESALFWGVRKMAEDDDAAGKLAKQSIERFETKLRQKCPLLRHLAEESARRPAEEKEVKKKHHAKEFLARTLGIVGLKKEPARARSG